MEVFQRRSHTKNGNGVQRVMVDLYMWPKCLMPVDRISTVIGCPGVMTILSHELAMTGPPAEVLCPSSLAGLW
jgi:hypothetical protein